MSSQEIWTNLEYLGFKDYSVSNSGKVKNCYGKLLKLTSTRRTRWGCEA